MKVKLILFAALIFLGFILGSHVNNFQPKVAGGEISARELKNALGSKDFTFINVHTPYEGEIAGTDSFIEYDSMKANVSRLPKDKNTPIVLYCLTGRMSTEAVSTLKSMGYTNVRHLTGGMEAWRRARNETLDLSSLPDQVLPKEGFELPVAWGDLGPRLIELGVIDLTKFEKAVQLTEEQRQILTQGSEAKLKIDAASSQFVVDLLWAAGLAQKSTAYTEGPMGTDYKDRVGSFASTGGWSLAKGDAVNYLGKYDLVSLDEAESKLVAEIAKGVYRPCCGNSTWFPDCNHGMAALFAIELMVDAGMTSDEIYENILKLNSFWFSSTYLTTATYFARQGVAWDKIDAKEVLGADFSSGQGAAKIAKEVGQLPYQNTNTGGSCGS
ncbi:hypothetical protein A2630_03555 [Candidatus Woesebacteria bacterium RIFCSPHIGHO2_01_FULL_44_10]|nr:MAG: hypothetical protein A2630_03555 [Candidatus Woesebacteria bacterium RIFCSPHIGHO2_01_FULL_44_10]OGM55958.1 MAG: hypothetical protein A3F62_05280 [Candidatus Woesebacteria bacterium RIFCSPHIGHO2_12_FULL_44_11]